MFNITYLIGLLALCLSSSRLMCCSSPSRHQAGWFPFNLENDAQAGEDGALPEDNADPQVTPLYHTTP